MGFYNFVVKVLGKPLRAMYKLEVVGTPDLPEEGCIVICNHTAFSDVILLDLALNRKVRFMAKRELFKIPLAGAFFRSLGAFPVNRGGADVNSIKTAMSLLEEKEVVGIFPQGTRMAGADLDTCDIKSGFALMSAKTDKPVQIIYIEGEAGKTHAFKKNTVHIGPLIRPSDYSAEKMHSMNEYNGYAKFAFSKIADMSRPQLTDGKENV